MGIGATSWPALPMKPLRAAIVAVFLPLVTAPWWFAGGLNGFWWGVPVWVIYCLAATGLLAVSIALWMGGWWDRLADAADAAGGDVASPGATDEGD
jgi:hypothetical protein